MTVICERKPTEVSAGFATYSTKEKGGETIYSFKREAADKLDAELSLGAAYDDEKGFKADTFDSFYKTELSLSAANFKAIETKDAAFVDLHNTDVYGENILDLEAMYQAKKDGYTVSLSVYLNKGAKLIVVTGVAETPVPHTHNLTWNQTPATATCTTAGNKAYWTATCSNSEGCTWDTTKKYDATGTTTGASGNEIADISQAALGHDYEVNGGNHVCKRDNTHTHAIPTTAAGATEKDTCTLCKGLIDDGTIS